MATLDKQHSVNEKIPSVDEKPLPETASNESPSLGEDFVDDNVIIITGEDAAAYLLPMRDDGDPAVTLRSLFLATGLSAFQAVMTQIYNFKPTTVSIQGTFIVLIAYFLGKAWAFAFPRGDLHLARWQSKGLGGKPPLWISIASFVNPGPWTLKEHAICSITATSASAAAASVQVFTAQKLFYDMPLTATTVICTTISLGLFGYGICGLLQPITVWHVEAVYWSCLPTVKTLQGLHWQSVKNSKPLRWFWYCFGGMFFYEFFPAYIWPWLNSVSVPCLASKNAKGSKAKTLTTLFGGATNNEGLGLFTLSFDWQYITSFQTSLPLTLQLHMALGYSVCIIAMLGIYYSNMWGAKSLPFMSTKLLLPDGHKYPISKLFTGGTLNHDQLAKYGLPKIAGTFVYGLMIGNAAIGALITHVALFWGADAWRSYKSSRKSVYNDPHHAHMVKHYKETPWWWFALTLLVSFVLGLVVVIKEDTTLPIWAYVVALVVGSFIAPFSNILYSRYGNGIATNNMSKMLAGLLIPERPVGNMYFAAWSHNVVECTVQLSSDLKMGDYLKIPPRVMFLTQCWGTIFGGFINYVVMISIVNSKADLLRDSNGNSSWSGAGIQAYNTNATGWALARYLYRAGAEYYMVPVGLAIGSALVIVHRIFAHFVPKVGRLSTYDLNLPQLIQYVGFIPYNQSQTCVILSQTLAGLYVQYYLRNYRPRIFRDYSYIITGAFDGAVLACLFILSFAVFGAGGKSYPFPQWWGNNVDGNYDFCPVAEA
ncbi:hypothetical protein AC579_4388 [Pseudocercospora musae]|uniref:OPT superfamily oligopeptide transporter n=1 Tax=Pseudocercospora musae TaxID=113226 RepID=A0A139IJS9_9PEZI|nr:hypothetical protein AC579_4388 [Pseudocercospora musae]